MRKIFHSGPNKVSFAVDSEDGRIRVALAFCGPRDQFTRKKANLILNRRLDHDGESRNVFELRSGAGPMEVFKVFMNTIHNLECSPSGRYRIDLLKALAIVNEAVLETKNG